METRKEMQRQAAIKRLRDLVNPGSRLSFVRVGPCSFRVWLLTDEIRASLAYHIALACGYRYNDRNQAEAIVVPGYNYSKQGDVLERLSHAIGVKLSSLCYEDL